MQDKNFNEHDTHKNEKLDREATFTFGREKLKSQEHYLALDHLPNNKQCSSFVMWFYVVLVPFLCAKTKQNHIKLAEILQKLLTNGQKCGII